MYKLVIAEKPSVAQSIAKVIGATNKKDGYLEGEWISGQLVCGSSRRTVTAGEL